MDYITFHVEMENQFLHIHIYLKNREDTGDNNSSHLKYLFPCGSVPSPYLSSHRCHFPSDTQLCTNSGERFHVPPTPDMCRYEKTQETVAKSLIGLLQFSCCCTHLLGQYSSMTTEQESLKLQPQGWADYHAIAFLFSLP